MLWWDRRAILIATQWLRLSSAMGLGFRLFISKGRLATLQKPVAVALLLVKRQTKE